MPIGTKESVTYGRVHKQLDGSDRRDLVYSVEVAGRNLVMTVLVTADADQEALWVIVRRLQHAAEVIAGLFQDLPIALSYDSKSPAPPAVIVADRHTRQQLGET